MKVITELSFYNNNNQVSDPIIIPYDPLQDNQAQTIAKYHCLLQFNRTRNQKALLWQLSRYYATAVVQTYYIFRK
ncbi:hypothetical protein C2G38_2215841 [Gigaspora rosea]|uniref:Uncharacterized protein n=1 Tax=Gigaspora rosea TaxID=44941 RepID=A0A397UIF8_9GLOM|nr:hypothetical protein C2G38_2215841 [Gigaspora rosea]